MSQPRLLKKSGRLPFVSSVFQNSCVGTDLVSIRAIRKGLFARGPVSVQQFINRNFSRFELPIVLGPWLRYLRSLELDTTSYDTYRAKHQLTDLIAGRWAVKEAALKASGGLAEGNSVHFLRLIPVLPQQWFETPKGVNSATGTNYSVGGNVVLIPDGFKRSTQRKLREFRMARCSISHTAGLALAVVQAPCRSRRALWGEEAAPLGKEATLFEGETAPMYQMLRTRIFGDADKPTFKTLRWNDKAVSTSPPEVLSDGHDGEIQNTVLIEEAARTAREDPELEGDADHESLENPFVTNMREPHENDPRLECIPARYIPEPRVNSYLRAGNPENWLKWLPHLLEDTGGTSHIDHADLIKDIKELTQRLDQFHESKISKNSQPANQGEGR